LQKSESKEKQQIATEHGLPTKKVLLIRLENLLTILFYADSYVGGLVIRQNKSGRTYAEIEADELAEKRRQEQKRKKAEIIRKKCEIEINNWKRSIIAKYQ